MVRTFNTHTIRKSTELTGCLWDFSSCQGEYQKEHYRVFTPCCWESHPKFAAYRGEGEYTTNFEAAGDLRLELKGVSHTATVYLDGKEIASHYNAYTIFDVVVTDIPKGIHTLTIKTDNRFSKASALHVPNDYMSYGGVTRPVLLEELHGVYIKWVHVTPYKKSGNWQAKVEVLVKNYKTTPQIYTVKAALAGENICWENKEIAGGEEFLFSKEIRFSEVVQWTPKNPKLYFVTATIYEGEKAVDDLIDRFGFRQVEIKDKDILLNGKKLQIKGICRHEDHPQFGNAIPVAAMAADLELIKDLGANSIRTAHYPNDELFLDLCDEQGILVWEENHARGLSEKDMKNPNFRRQAMKVIEEMIPAHYNHPSIYIWGILNECASDTEYGKECYKEEFELIKKLDQSRPHSFASCKFKTDICFGLPNVVSYNIYPLWYHDTPVEEYLDDLYQWIQKETQGAGKPFMITEIGAGGLYGYHNSYHSKWTEEYQADALEKQLKAVLNYENCLGVYIWQFCDIRISEEWFGGRPRTMNNKGIVDEYRRQKLAYDVAKKIFTAI